MVRRMNSKKMGKSIILVLAMVFIFGISAMAASYVVYDDAGVFTEEDVVAIDASMNEVAAYTQWDLITMTTNDTEGMGTEAYAKAILEANIESDSGIILLFDFENSMIQVESMGEALTFLSNDRVDEMIETAQSYTASDDYAGAAQGVWALIPSYYDGGTKDDSESGLTGGDIVIALLAFLLIGGGFAIFIIGKYRLKFGGYEYSFRANGTVDLTHSNDHFVNVIVTRRHIPKADSNGGGSGSGNRGGGGGKM